MPTDDPRNRLLAALPDADFKRCSPHLEVIELTPGLELQSADFNRYAYFPTTAVVSLRQNMANGKRVEVAPVGREGLVGLSMFMGGASVSGSAVVRCAGSAFRIDAQWLEQECRTAVTVLSVLVRYSRALLAQVSQTAICNRYHALGQQVCRLLLWCLDRVDGNLLRLTHEQIAGMLGVRRSGVTEFALQLRALGIIRYRHGQIAILDRRALEQRTCECYRVVEEEYDRLLPSLARRR